MASAVSQLLAARNVPRLCHSSIDTIVTQECVGVYIVQTVSYGRRMNRGQTASWSIFSLKIQGVDISSPIEFPRSFHTIVSRMTNR
jgi:hypothetical protein